MPVSPTISVIVPALNEARNLPIVLPRIPASVSEVILVDGHSTDDTVAVARAVMPAIRIIPLTPTVETTSAGTGQARPSATCVVTSSTISTI